MDYSGDAECKAERTLKKGWESASELLNMKTKQGMKDLVVDTRVAVKARHLIPVPREQHFNFVHNSTIQISETQRKAQM